MRIEKRRAPRRIPQAEEPLTQMRLRTGRELQVVDVADAGALVEGEARLLPGTHVDVHVTTREGRVLVRSRVIRAYVCDVQPACVRYRGALAFDAAVNTTAPGYLVPSGGRGLTAQGSGYPIQPRRDSTAMEERLTA
jgi:hypothetical protein